MRLRIVTPVRPIVDAEVTEVVAPGSEGELGVLPLHVTFLGGLKPGVLSYTSGGARKRVVIGGGYAEVRQDAVTILADEAQLPEEVDVSTARADLARLQEELARGVEGPEKTEQVLRGIALAEAKVAIASAN